MSKNQLKWNFVFQYGYVITNMINAFLLLPFYVLYIDDVQLGLWWATGNILAWLTLADPGIGDVLQQKIAELLGKKENIEISKTIGAGLLASLFTFILSIFVGILFYYLLEIILNIDLKSYEELNNSFLISILSTGITLFTFALAGINQGMLRSKQVAISYITSNIIFLIVNLLLLIAGFGLMSIAISNIVRATYLAIYNLIVIFYTKSELSKVFIIDYNHFKKFIQIFSFTAISRVISSFSNNIDLVILPRFISPQLITIFEINRRPIKMLQGLVGRYSVALMPGISNSYGEDQTITRKRILNQFNIFLIFTSAITCLSILCYEQLISLWMDSSKFAGIQITLLLVFNFFFGLIGYFFSNMTYAIGDIKYNSFINTLKGIVLLVFIPIGAFINGVIGILWVSLIVSIFIDFTLFFHRMYRLEIFKLNRNIVKNWFSIILISAICLIGTNYLFNNLFIRQILLKMTLNTLTFCVSFFLVLFLLNSNFKQLILKK